MELADIPDILLLRSLTTPLSSFQVLRRFDEEHSAAEESSSRLVLLLLLGVPSWKHSWRPLFIISSIVMDDASANSNSSCWAALFQTILSFCTMNFSIIMFLSSSPSGGIRLCHSSMMVIDTRHLVVAGGISFTKKYQKYFLILSCSLLLFLLLFLNVVSDSGSGIAFATYVASPRVYKQQRRKIKINAIAKVSELRAPTHRTAAPPR